MRIGIITMVSDNYGNRLQNYALQNILSELGNSVETLNNPWFPNYNVYLEWLKFNIKKFLFFITKRPERFQRRINFDQFNHDNISFSRYWLNKNNDRIAANKYFDMFICGSDQVWNSEAAEIDGKYFADFADHDKRASYAASFGIEKIVDDRREEFTRYLLGMRHISVREHSGKQIVEELINRRVSCHIDPTLLLSGGQWDKIANQYRVANNKYIFCYFLGKPTETILDKLREYKKKNNIDVLSIWNGNDASHNNVGPGEFLALIKGAEFVLTDSFHGTAFSVIYHKSFYTFSRNGVRESMDTRVVSLLELLGLADRFEPKNWNLYDNLIIDFHNADCILENERKKAIEYLAEITQQKA